MASRKYVRPLVEGLRRALRRNPPFIQVLVGARQTGKTTAAEQIAESWGDRVVTASADLPLPPGPEWIETQWLRARREAASTKKPVLLVLDEIQKVRG